MNWLGGQFWRLSAHQGQKSRLWLLTPGSSLCLQLCWWEGDSCHLVEGMGSLQDLCHPSGQDNKMQSFLPDNLVCGCYGQWVISLHAWD